MRKLLPLIMALLIMAFMLQAQTKPVTGTIRNDKGDPIPYATIQEEGTSNNTVADAGGAFSLTAGPNARLLITATGFGATTVSAREAASVVLRTTVGQLGEVVVVAYGTQKRTNITGSVSTIGSAELENKPFTSVDKSLQGLVAGLQSTSASGAPGSATDVRIRGVGSITASASPLYVIDGVIATVENTSSYISFTFNVLSTLNPDDIESITVLKDAAAQSVYGSRAANGVILITTKKGRAGKTRLTLSTEAGQNSKAFQPQNKPVTTLQYQTLMREAVINAGYATNNAGADAFITDNVAGLGVDPAYLKTNTDWTSEIVRKATQQQYNLSLGGGNEKTQIYASGGYFKQTGIVPFTSYSRTNGSLSVSHRLTDKALFTSGINTGYVSQRTPVNSGYYANPVYAAFFLPPWYSPRNADGSLKYNDPQNQFPGAGAAVAYNPLALGLFTNERNQQTTFRGYLSGEYQLLNGLKFTSRYSGEFFNIQEDQYRSSTYGDGQGGSGFGYASYRRIFNWTWSNYFDYQRRFGKGSDLSIDVKLGYEAQQLKNYVIFTGGIGFPQNTALQYLTSAATPISSYTNSLEQSTTSLFSIASLNYKDRYVVSGSFRRDASSVFGSGNRNGNFYSAGATWNLNQEAFIQDIASISLLKLRTSYGQNGNQSGIGYYTSQATFSYGNAYLNGVSTPNNYAGQVGSSLNSVGNPELTWEKNAVFNAGVDFGFWKNRLFGTVELYNRKTTSLLLNVPLSATSGVIGQNRNVGAITNKGVEITLGGKLLVLQDFSWTITASLSHNTNRITELYQGNTIPDPSGNLFNYTVGHNIYEFYTRQWAGVDPANGNPQWYTGADHSKKTSDVSGANLSLSGKSALPAYFGSVTNSFTWQGLTLDAQFYYNTGNWIFMTYSRDINSDGTLYGLSGHLSEQLDSWKKPGDVTLTPKLVAGGNMNSNATSTRFLYKGDYVRLRNMQLSYALPTALLRKARLSTTSMYVRGTNLLTFAADKRLPVDPETGIISTGQLDVFIPKTITAGIQIGL